MPNPSNSQPDLATHRTWRKVVLLSALSLLVVATVAGCCYLLWQQLELDRSAREVAVAPKPEIVNDVSLGYVDNPIDFDALKARNPDIYAWIYIPGTDVNLPVLEHPTDDAFYLEHNADGDYAIEGSIYSEAVNGTDFSDPVTVLYGHYLENGTMFSSLHSFEDETFFRENSTMCLYTEDRMLTYRIVAAYVYDDRHIMKSFDFSNPSVVREYFDYVLNPQSPSAQVRVGESLADDDTIVQLSTCTSPTDYTSDRYIVTGVLVDERPAR